MTGGEKLQEYLRKVGGSLGATGRGYQVRVGFMEDAMYQDGKSVATIAAIQEFGATINVAAGSVTVYRLKGKKGQLLRKGRFVRKAKANFVTTHARGAHTITIPPRPFFRNMIKKGAPHWGHDLATALRANDLDVARALGVLGNQLVGEIQTSINETNDPPNAPSTIRRKGAAKPLIDTGQMWKSVSYVVDAP